ncbi:MAG TPA: acyltransferase [Bacteroidota bacterium]|jgi:acetyltransferase-like isoleucine patch superfamily enzyme|nr:acyltransferase [Bacteroidota bacterium]
MKKTIEKIVQRLGKKHYHIDKSLTLCDLIKIVIQRLMMMLRGSLLMFRLKKSSGIIFVGRNVKVRFAGRISVGNTLTIEDNVEINALSNKGIIIGNNVTIKSNSIIECTGVIRELGEGLMIGNNVGISQGAFIQVRGFVKIGSNVMFGPHVSIFSENHGIDDITIPIIEQPSIRKGVVIEDDVWIGANSTILDGVIIGKGSVIAAGSVVTKNILPYTVVAGVPAKTIRQRG